MNKLKFMFLFVLLAAFVSCKKDENQVYFQGGTAPVLAANKTGPITLAIANANAEAVTFNWTNPEYRFSTGISSHDVQYRLQVDTTGANFTNPNIQEVSIAKNLDYKLTVKELNTMMTKMNLQDNVPHNMEFRLRASLENNSVPLFSNVIKMTVTPYLDVAVPVPPTGELYITGSAVASDWTNSPPASQKFTKISNTEYRIVVNLVSGKEYKFLSTLGQWQPQYGGSSATGGDLGYNMGGGSDPSGIPSPATSGSYTITVNFKTGKYSVQ